MFNTTRWSEKCRFQKSYQKHFCLNSPNKAQKQTYLYNLC